MERNSFKSKSILLSDLFRIVGVAADSDAPVLIAGSAVYEKEFFARMLHFDGKRANEPFVCMDCARSESDLACEFFSCVQKAGKGINR